MSPAPLTDRDRAILDFEREWWKHAGSKDSAVRDRFALSTSAYHRSLSRLIDSDLAVEHDSVLVRRLRRQRATRRLERSALRHATPTDSRVPGVH